MLVFETYRDIVGPGKFSEALALFNNITTIIEFGLHSLSVK